MDDWYMKITNAEDEADMTGLPSWKPTSVNEHYSEFAYVLSLFILIVILIFPLILIQFLHGSKRNMQSRSSTMLVGDDASTFDYIFDADGDYRLHCFDGMLPELAIEESATDVSIRPPHLLTPKQIQIPSTHFLLCPME